MAKHVIALAIFCPVMLIFSADFVASFSGAIYFVSIFYFFSRTVLGRKAVRKYYVEILKMEKQYLTPKNKSMCFNREIQQSTNNSRKYA